MTLVIVVIVVLVVLTFVVLRAVFVSESASHEDQKIQTKRRAAPEGQRWVRSPDVVYREEYLDPVTEGASLSLDAHGLPTGVLRRERDRLVIVTTAGMVNPKSRSLHRLGLYSFQIRGSGYTNGAVKRGNFALGANVRLVREPNNIHDENAIAVYAGSVKAGYVNKQNAARLSRVMDSGRDVEAISTRGARAGEDSNVPQILAGEPKVIAHLLREIR